MPPPAKRGDRVVKAVHASRAIAPDPRFEIDLARQIASEHDREALLSLYARFTAGDCAFDARMRRVVLRALAKRLGDGVLVGLGVKFKHPETFEIGAGVFLGADSYLQGRFDGRCVIGERTWIGPQSYFDARDLVIGKSVGWGPGAKVIGSAHSGLPVGVPVIKTDLTIKTVRIGDWCDIGAGAVILPGVSIGKGCLIGAGAVVTKDIPAFSVAAGVPARVIRSRKP